MWLSPSENYNLNGSPFQIRTESEIDPVKELNRLAQTKIYVHRKKKALSSKLYQIFFCFWNLQLHQKRKKQINLLDWHKMDLTQTIRLDAILSKNIKSYLNALPQVQSTPGNHESHLA